MWARQGTKQGGRLVRAAVSAGFTFIEVIGVLVLLGLLGIAAFGRLESGNVRALAQADGLRTAIRYAQSRAMADVYTWGITASGSQYALFSDNPDATSAPLPGQGSNTYVMPTGVEFESPATVTFDWRGQPVSGNISKDTPSAEARSTPLTINITESSQVVRVTVTPYTGFVP
jgi:type II secretory pathway pseudopilin PulG